MKMGETRLKTCSGGHCEGLRRPEMQGEAEGASQRWATVRFSATTANVDAWMLGGTDGGT